MYLRNPIQPIRRTRPSRRARISRIRPASPIPAAGRPAASPCTRGSVALAMATSFISFPILPNPAFSFLKYDPSGIVCLIAGFGVRPQPRSSVSASTARVHGPRGMLMAVLVALSLSVPAASSIATCTRAGAVIGLVVGALLALVAAIAGNLVITPIYTGWPVSEVAAIIVPALLPFNLIKFVIHGVVTFLVYKPISNLLNR